MKSFLGFVVLLTLGGVIVRYFIFHQENPTSVSLDLMGTAPPKEKPESATVYKRLPTAKTLSGGIAVFQTFNNCGPAALSMALSFYGENISQNELGLQLRPYQHPTGDNDDKSVTLAELAIKAEELGFIAYHRPAGTIEKIQQFIAADIPVITRTWLKPGEDIGHYRVVKGYDQDTKTLVQNDSLQGANLVYHQDEFLQLWEAFNYEYLVFVPKGRQAEVETILNTHTDENAAWGDALQISDQNLTENASDIYAQFNRSVALYYLGQYAESVRQFEAVRSRLPRRMLWYQIEPILSYFMLDRNDTVQAITSKILADENRAFSELYFLRSQIYKKQGRTLESQSEMDLARRYNLHLSYERFQALYF